MMNVEANVDSGVAKVLAVKTNSTFMACHLTESTSSTQDSLMIYKLIENFFNFLQQTPVKLAFEDKIIDFNFNDENSLLFTCLKSCEIKINDPENQFRPIGSIKLDNHLNVREIICFNNQTLLIALQTQ